MDTKVLREHVNNEILAYWGHCYRDLLGLNDWRERCYKRLTEEDIPINEIVSWPEIRHYLGGKVVLDVGCGTGSFCMASKLEGSNIFGIDKDQKAIEICKLRALIYKIPESHFQTGTAENLPFADSTFDFVYCNATLEHVYDVKKTISEMLRVAKMGSMLFIKFPDYRSFYEGHYKIAWIPKMPKNLARLYLRMRGRPTGIIDSINYTTLPLIRGYLKKGFKIEKEKVICGGNIFEKIYFRMSHIGRYVELLIRKTS